MGLIGRNVLTVGTLKTVAEPVLEWDGEILLRELSAAQTVELTQFGASANKDDPAASLRLAAWVIVAAWVDENGAPVLGAGDIDTLLATQTADIINRLAQRIMVLSGLAPAALAGAEKNSGSRQNDDSGTP